MSYLFVTFGAIATIIACAKVASAMIRQWNFSAVRDESLENRAGKQWQDIDRCLRQTLRVHSIAQRPTHWQEVLVTRIQPESHDVKSFYLVSPDGRPLASFLPGQHVVVQRQGHAELPEDSRCYSLSADCAEGFWRISVKRQSDHPESFSRWICDEIQVGDSLRVRGPSGSFYLNARPQQNVVLASAGIGITPLIPMLIECIRRRQATIHVFAQFRDLDHMPFAASLMNLVTKYSSLQGRIFISRVPANIRIGESNLFRSGKFKAADLLASVQEFGTPDDSTEFYFCGPELWQNALKADLMEHQVAEHRIHYERFDSPFHNPAQSENSSEAPSRKIVFAQSGSFAQFEATHGSLLQCAKKNHVPIESGCRSGACGACAVRMLEGKIRYTKAPQFQPKANEILPCICVPETDLVVDA